MLTFVQELKLLESLHARLWFFKRYLALTFDLRVSSQFSSCKAAAPLRVRALPNGGGNSAKAASPARAIARSLCPLTQQSIPMCPTTTSTTPCSVNKPGLILDFHWLSFPAQTQETPIGSPLEAATAAPMKHLEEVKRKSSDGRREKVLNSNLGSLW